MNEKQTDTEKVSINITLIVPEVDVNEVATIRQKLNEAMSEYVGVTTRMALSEPRRIPTQRVWYR